MKHFAPFILCAALATPALAQDDEDGFSLMEEGARLLFQGIMTEMEPALEDLRDMAEDLEPRFRALATEMGPALVEMLEDIDDFRNYEPPEFLDNGDIIIRRKPDAPLYMPTEPGEEIEL